MAIETTHPMVKNIYSHMRKNLDVIRKRMKKPLTLAEKIMYGHLSDPKSQELKRVKAF